MMSRGPFWAIPRMPAHRPIWHLLLGSIDEEVHTPGMAAANPSGHSFLFRATSSGIGSLASPEKVWHRIGSNAGMRIQETTVKRMVRIDAPPEVVWNALSHDGLSSLHLMQEEGDRRLREGGNLVWFEPEDESHIPRIKGRI